MPADCPMEPGSLDHDKFQLHITLVSIGFPNLVDQYRKTYQLTTQQYDDTKMSIAPDMK